MEIQTKPEHEERDYNVPYHKFFDVHRKAGRTDHVFINSMFESTAYEDEMLIYFCLRMLEKPRNNPPSRNAFRVDYEHYVKLFEHLQAEGYIDKYTEIPDGGGHINITLTHVTTAGQEFIKDHDYLEELYQSLINGY